MELEDADLVLVEASPLAPEVIQAIRDSLLSKEELEPIEVLFTPIDVAQPAPSEWGPAPPDSVVVPKARASCPSFPRLVWDAVAENDVADECLASIAAETSKTKRSIVPFAPPQSTPQSTPHSAPTGSSPFLPSAPERDEPATLRQERPILPLGTMPAREAQVDPQEREQVVKLPKASPPPFVRGGLWARKRPSVEASAVTPSDARKPLPSLFARTSESSLPVAVASQAATMAKGRNEPTVIVLRERPRGMWVFGSAAMGALLAVTIMHLIGAQPPKAPPPTIVTLAPPPATSDEIIPPAPSGSTKPAVVHFSDDQGVAIAKPKPKPTATAPKSSGPAPMVPDGATVKVEVPPPAAAAKPKKALTPDQELSEAQLKASLMK